MHHKTEKRDILGKVPGVAAMRNVFGHLAGLATTHPTWSARFDACDLDVCDTEELELLLAGAPTDTARAYIAGILSMRIAIAHLAERQLSANPTPSPAAAAVRLQLEHPDVWERLVDAPTQRAARRVLASAPAEARDLAESILSQGAGVGLAA